MLNEEKQSKDPEAIAIIAKLKKAKPSMGKPMDDDADESNGDVNEENQLSAAEDLFQAIRGRAPSEQEAEAVRAALQAYREACE